MHCLSSSGYLFFWPLLIYKRMVAGRWSQLLVRLSTLPLQGVTGPLLSMRSLQKWSHHLVIAQQLRAPRSTRNNLPGHLNGLPPSLHCITSVPFCWVRVASPTQITQGIYTRIKIPKMWFKGANPEDSLLPPQLHKGENHTFTLATHHESFIL